MNELKRTSLRLEELASKLTDPDDAFVWQQCAPARPRPALDASTVGP